MLRKLCFGVFLIGLLGPAAFGQGTGSIKGKVVDKSSGEPLPFANVVAESNGNQVGGAQTDFDGNYTIKPLKPGTYDVKASFVGYTTGIVTGVLVSTDKITFEDIKLTKGAVDIKAVEITAYTVPLIDKGQTSTQQTLTSEQIEAAPSRSINSVAATSVGIVQEDDGDALNIRGSRSNATDYIVDGVRIRGNARLPQASVDQITVKTGGQEAQYGENTGGVIVISTKGPSEDYAFGGEFVTSELFDDYGYNLAAVNVSGPIVRKTDETGTRSIAGFFIAGEYQYEKDPDPSAIGVWKLKDGVLNELKESPLQLSANGLILEPRAQNITFDDVEKANAKHNFAQKSWRVNTRLDIAPWKNISFAVGGNFDRQDSRVFSWNNELFNFEHNENRIQTNANAYFKFTQKFAGTVEKDKTSLFSNAYYTIQFDYSKFDQIRQDNDHKDNLFDYGYIGRFTQYRRNSFFTAPPGFYFTVVNGDTVYTIQTGWVDSLYTFSPGGVNLEGQAYTSQYFNYANNQVTNLNQVLTNNALGNGSAGTNVYGIWNPFGQVFNLYQTVQQDQYTAKFTASADIKNHNFMVGFEYEQRVERLFGINPRGLWPFMRSLANFNRRFDATDSVVVNGTLIWTPSYTNTDELGRPGFYQKVRDKLGLGELDYVDIDSYDRSLFSLDLFTADELLNDGNSIVGYYGYDYTGQKASGSVSFNDFFKKVDADGNYTRDVDAFRPIYMAGFIQDKFAINDLIFNIGVRIDRFDANQKVLKDPYLLYEAKTVGDLGLQNRPAGIGDDFIPYVKDINNPSVDEIIGYRDGDIWYDADGQVVSDPSVLAQISSSTRIFPWLADLSNATPGAIREADFDPDKSFKDYEPQISVMPRIAFSFPISDQAQFFAHYDVLTQRPPARLRMDPTNYFFLDQVQGPLIDNPSLKPEKTTDYEIGFKQTLSKSSAMSISAFYRELRNQIQQIQLPFAYPNTYLTYGNIDFGTVKGLVFSYDLRRTGNVRLNVSYTLQFADGTGSNDAAANKLLNNGLPNLRSLTPLDFDQRHVFVAVMDYRYGAGKNYNGPMLFNKPFLSNTGLNVEFKVNSGTPFTANRDITNQAGNIGLQQIGSGVLAGSVNGSRLPWQYRINLRVNKEFELKMGEEKKRGLKFNVYFAVLNLLDTKNVINVYAATGVPDDDGYIASAAGQDYVNSLPVSQQDPYVDMYAMKVVNPNNYSLPRRMRLGLQIDF